jgi:hypothetical protein
MLNWMRTTWCKNVHTGAMWPINGKYICPRCLHEYAVPWETPAPRHTPQTATYAAEHRLAQS